MGLIQFFVQKEVYRFNLTIGMAVKEAEPTKVWDLSELTVKMGKMLEMVITEKVEMVEILQMEAKVEMVAKMEIKLEEMAISEAEEVEVKLPVIIKQK
jgi:CRISPR/Cas system CMR-associated protein Cmr3 (group 5 of RAMP superfamily)